MAAAPILPTQLDNPTGLDALIRAAMDEMGKRLRRVARVYIAALDQIPTNLAVNARYQFAIDGDRFQQILDAAGAAVDAILLEGDSGGLWFFENYVQVAYTRGTAQEFANLAKQSPVYKAGRVSLRSILSDSTHRVRVAMVRAREFEEMRGLSNTVKADMARLLSDGIARGKNPLDIARNLREQAGIEEYRANRIARTEIPTALRRARMDEADAATEQYNLRSMQMHMSALGPTTRATHAGRHGELFTSDDQRDWWSSDGNSINCACSTVTVLVDDKGSPLVPTIQNRAKSMLSRYKAENQE